MALWSGSEGFTLREADSRDAVERYLANKPCLSFVARDDGQMVGAVLAGTDGRRGYLQHCALQWDDDGRSSVRKSNRRR
jgi:hypothetical protein